MLKPWKKRRLLRASIGKKVLVSLLSLLFVFCPVLNDCLGIQDVYAASVALEFGDLLLSDVLWSIGASAGVLTVGSSGAKYVSDQNKTTIQDLYDQGILVQNGDDWYTNLRINEMGKIERDGNYTLSENEYQILEDTINIAATGGNGGQLPSDPNDKKPWLTRIFQALGTGGTKGFLAGLAMNQLITGYNAGVQPFYNPSIQTGVSSSYLTDYSSFYADAVSAGIDASYSSSFSLVQNSTGLVKTCYCFSNVPVYPVATRTSDCSFYGFGSPDTVCSYYYVTTAPYPNQIIGSNKIGSNGLCSFPGSGLSGFSILTPVFHINSNSDLLALNPPLPFSPDIAGDGEMVTKNTDISIPINIAPNIDLRNALNIPTRPVIQDVINNINNYNTTNQPNQITNEYNNFYNNYITNVTNNPSVPDPQPTVSPIQPTPIPTVAPEQDEINKQYVTEGLTDLFPFCIPFDLAQIFSAFTAERSAPVITIPFVSTLYGYDQDVTLDFSMFDSAASVFRTMELIAFVIALILLTKNILF